MACQEARIVSRRSFLCGGARFLSASDGPRIGVLSYNGWDTHANEGPIRGQLAMRLDRAIGAFETGMGAAWRNTVAVVVTEFGRTVRVNGTEGTDHGMATIALLVGGCEGRSRPRRLARFARPGTLRGS